MGTLSGQANKAPSKKDKPYNLRTDNLPHYDFPIASLD